MHRASFIQVMSQYASVLECLLRLRQVCCAVSLVPQGRLQQAKKVLNQLSKDGPALGKEASSDEKSIGRCLGTGHVSRRTSFA